MSPQRSEQEGLCKEGRVQNRVSELVDHFVMSIMTIVGQFL